MALRKIIAVHIRVTIQRSEVASTTCSTGRPHKLNIRKPMMKHIPSSKTEIELRTEGRDGSCLIKIKSEI